MPRLLTFSSHWHLKFLLKTPAKRPFKKILFDSAGTLSSAQQEVCHWEKVDSKILWICNIFQSHSIAMLSEYILRYSICLYYSAWGAQRAYRKKHVIRTWFFSTSGIFALFRHYQWVLARIIRQTVCAERDNSHGSDFATDTVKHYEECDISPMCCRQQLADETRSKSWCIIERLAMILSSTLYCFSLCVVLSFYSDLTQPIENQWLTDQYQWYRWTLFQMFLEYYF